MGNFYVRNHVKFTGLNNIEAMHRRTPILFTRVKFAYLRALEKIRDRGNPPLVKAKIPLIFLADHDIYFIAKPGQNKQIQNLFFGNIRHFPFPPIHAYHFKKLLKSALNESTFLWLKVALKSDVSVSLRSAIY